MKFALVLALAPDRQSGRVLGDLVTADDAVKAVKAAINTGRAPDARFPQLVAVGINDVLRQHRFNVTAEQVAEDTERFKPVTLEQSFEPITVEIVDGENKHTVTLYFEEDAEFVRTMAAAGLEAHKQLQQQQLTREHLQKIIADAQADVNAKAAEITTLQKKLEAAQEGAIGLETARADAVKRIAELEAQLAEATKPKPEPEADKQPKEGDEPAKEGSEPAKASKKK